MKKVLYTLGLLFMFSVVSAQTKSLHDFTVESITGESYKLSELKGKKVMIVNTASKCGLTPQYKDLQALYNQYGGDKFEIVGFPANNFLKQEPGTNDEIKAFCTENYGVSFPMMAKISVKGDDIHPLYVWLTSKTENGVMDSKVKWNFQKYLINEKGELVDVIYPRTSPMDEKVINWLKK